MESKTDIPEIIDDLLLYANTAEARSSLAELAAVHGRIKLLESTTTLLSWLCRQRDSCHIRSLQLQGIEDQNRVLIELISSRAASSVFDYSNQQVNFHYGLHEEVKRKIIGWVSERFQRTIVGLQPPKGAE